MRSGGLIAGEREREGRWGGLIGDGGWVGFGKGKVVSGRQRERERRTGFGKSDGKSK